MSISAAIKAFFSRRRDSSSSQKGSTAPSLKQSQVNVDPKSTMTSQSMSNKSQIDSKDGLNFQFQGGRRYQNEDQVSYVLPNDYDELDRIHQQHWMLRYILQSNFFSPIEKRLKEGIHVLDAGCGPGTWTLEMAETYPSSKFVGIDTSCVFPENIKPGNVEFVIANLAKPLPFPDNHFDYIHQRFLLLGLTSDDWDADLQELYRVLKPGGYIELVEPNYEKGVHMGPLVDDLQEKVKTMMKMRKLVPGIALELKDRLNKAGFVYKSERQCILNMNHTDKGGELFWTDFKDGYTGLRPALALLNKDWEDPKAFENYLNQVGEECKENKTYAEMFIYCAQKPSITK